MRPASPLRSFALLSIVAVGVAACGDGEPAETGAGVDAVADVQTDAADSADAGNDTAADALEPLPEPDYSGPQDEYIPDTTQTAPDDDEEFDSIPF